MVGLSSTLAHNWVPIRNHGHQETLGELFEWQTLLLFVVASLVKAEPVGKLLQRWAYHPAPIVHAWSILWCVLRGASSELILTLPEAYRKWFVHCVRRPWYGVASHVQAIHLPLVLYGRTISYLVPRDQCEVSEPLQDIADSHDEMICFGTRLPVQV